MVSSTWASGSLPPPRHSRRLFRRCAHKVRIVQLGIAEDLPIPIAVRVGKEIGLVGSHRFDEEFAEAVRLIDSRLIDVRPIHSASYPLEDALAAFDHAGDRS